MKMSKRYFDNACIESQSDDLNVNDVWKGRIKQLVKEVKKNFTKSQLNDLYLGTAGITYMFYYLAKREQQQNDITIYLNDAMEIINLKRSVNLIHGHNKFLCGDAGINAVNAAIYQLKGDEKMTEFHLQHFKDGLKHCKQIDFLRTGKDELFYGRTGYLFGVLWLEKEFGRKIISDEDIIELCSIIIDSGRKYSEKNNSIFPLMYSFYNTEYLGKYKVLS